ncbi:MAG: hypothetical protein WA667_16095 [Candidatus Nitrosopolaris sp.]
MKFVNDFKHIVVLIAAVAFLLIIMFIIIRQEKRLPLSYTIQILDSHGEKIILPDLRLSFRKYEVAESYAQFYRGMYGQQYKFRVIGLRKDTVV